MFSNVWIFERWRDRLWYYVHSPSARLLLSIGVVGTYDHRSIFFVDV